MHPLTFSLTALSNFCSTLVFPLITLCSDPKLKQQILDMVDVFAPPWPSFFALVSIWLTWKKKLLVVMQITAWGGIKPEADVQEKWIRQGASLFMQNAHKIEAFQAGGRNEYSDHRHEWTSELSPSPSLVGWTIKLVVSYRATCRGQPWGDVAGFLSRLNF